MKVLLLLSVLFLSLGTAKAQVPTEEQKLLRAYWLGSISGSASALCELAKIEKITNEEAQVFMDSVVEAITNNPELADVHASATKFYSELKSEGSCKGIL